MKSSTPKKTFDELVYSRIAAQAAVQMDAKREKPKLSKNLQLLLNVDILIISVLMYAMLWVHNLPAAIVAFLATVAMSVYIRTHA